MKQPLTQDQADRAMTVFADLVHWLWSDAAGGLDGMAERSLAAVWLFDTEQRDRVDALLRPHGMREHRHSVKQSVEDLRRVLKRTST